jgi:RND family efflux transporter MFP subunit
MKLWIFIIVFVVAIGALIGWRFETKAAATQQLARGTATRKQAQGNIVTAAAHSGDILEHVDVVGSVNTPFDVKLAPKVAGAVNYLEVRPGDQVTANQVLVRIDPSEIQAQVAQQRGAVAEAQQRYTQAVLTTNPATVQVTTAIGQQKASVASAQANQSQTEVNYSAQVATSQAAVSDATSKVATATAQLASVQQGVVSAQANYNDANVKYNRTYSLYQQGYIAAQQVDDAKAARDVASAAVQAAQQAVNASIAAVNSAKAQLDSANQQLKITKLKGKSDIVAAQAVTRQAQESLKLASSNRAQVPAYQANLAALKATVAAAQGQLQDVEAQLNNTVLRSPVSGTVTLRNIDPGSMASAGQQVLEVQFLDWLYVTASAPIEKSAAIQVGQTAELTFDSFPGQTFTATISNVTPAADPSSRQFMFQMKLQNPERKFKPGMYAHVDIVTNRTPADVLVPNEAIKKGDDGPTVILVDSSNIAHVTPVKTGASDSANTQILSGVKAGDQIVTLSYQPVKDGAKVYPNGKGVGAPGAGGGSGGGGGGGKGRHGGGAGGGAK